jgi:oxygen-independent coproporphyrinogen-3 oxidase
MGQIVRAATARDLTEVKCRKARTRQSLTTMNATSTATSISPELLRRFDIPGPRYTSYPTADRFVEAFTEQQYEQALAQRRDGPSALSLPLSLYVHIPFCESLCYYCACNKIITKHHERAQSYLRYLGREMDLHTSILGADRPVTQLHLGGGSPTFLSDAELAQLMAMLRRGFAIAPGAECSIEVDPRTVDAVRLQALSDLGFNRISFGVQDFDPDVQKAVHRVQPADQVFALMEQARAVGFDSVNVDLIYGLPRQTPESFARTLRQISELRPDRIALYAYAHLPERFKSQRRIAQADLPAPAAKVSMLSQALASFEGDGYVYVGMDHFALPGDALAVAKRQGRLHRNFQGYSTQPDCDLIGLGVSAIGRIGATYSQNAKTLAEYCDHIDQGRLPVVRGLALSRDDLARRAVIMALMCQGEVVFESIEVAWLLDFKKYFAAEIEMLAEYREQGLVTMDDTAIQVTAKGWFFVRAIAMLFDRYLQADRNRAKFSRIL